MTSAGRRVVGALALGTFLAGLPVTGGFRAGGLEIGFSKAFAKDGRDDNGGDDRGGGSSGSGKGGGGKSSSSGKGSSGKGGGDDNGGRGGSGRGGGDDRGGDDRGGRGRGGDDRGGDDNGGRRGGDDRGGQGAARAATGGGALSVVKVERSASGVEITYSNGVKEEIENGRFEQKDAAGRTVIERAATRSDLARLDGNARRSRIVVPTGGAPRVEASGTAIEVSYPTGWREELEGGRYELKDPNNNTVVERAATSADVRRLRALARR